MEKKTILGSHQSMTYLPAKGLLNKLISFTARCQEVPLHEQFWNYNCRMFDIRVRFDKHGLPVLAHGPIVWKYGKDFSTIYSIFLNLNRWAIESKEDVYVRLILESNSEMKDQAEQEVKFIGLCKYCEDTYKHLHFFGGVRKYDWKSIYTFNTETPTIADKYSSVNNVLIDDLWPKKYAKKYNSGILADKYDEDYLLIDFVNIQ